MLSDWRWLVALRLFGTASANQFMSFVGILSIGGLAVAVAVLLSVLSVVNGFEKELRNRVLAVLPHGTIYSRQGFSDWRALQQQMLDHPEVLGAAPVVEGSALVVADGNMTGVAFRGIDVDQEASVSILPDFVQPGALERLSRTRFGLLIGRELAGTLSVSTGDQVSLVLPDVQMSLAGPVVTTKRMEVSGLFEVGADMDKSHVFLNLDDARRLKRQKDIDGIVIRVADLFQVQTVIPEITSHDYTLYGVSWMHQNGNLYDAIGTQKATLFLLLMLLVMVAMFNVVSNLAMTVDDNRAEIAILRTLGATPWDLKVVFMIHGMVVGVVGLLLGLLIGLLLTWSLVQLYEVISDVFELNLMKEYFIRYLPVEVQVGDVLMISGASLLVSLLATLYPAGRAAAANPVEALQYDV